MSIKSVIKVRGRLLILAGVFALASILYSNGSSQEIGNVAGSDPRIGLKMALESFSSGNFHRAADLFSQLKISFPQDPRYSIFTFMLARTHLKLGKLETAKRGFEKFVKEFPASRYIGYSLLLLGDILFKQDDSFGAAYYYIQSYERLQSKDLKQKARLSMENVVNTHISLIRLDELSRHALNYDLSPYMLYLKAKRELRSGMSRKAKGTISLLRDKFPDSEFSDKSRQLEDMVRPGGDRVFRIGILAPLSGRLSSYGIDMLRGIKLALEDFNRSYPSPATALEIYDNFGTQGETIKGMDRLAASDVDVIIGPLKSGNAYLAAAVNKSYNIPMVIPAAAAKGISSVTEGVFQITPNSEFIGQIMADYAINELLMNQFAVLSPNDDFGEDVSAAFTQEVIRLGGEVVKISFYQRGISDFRRPLTEIKDIMTAGLDTLIEQGLVDSSLYFNPKKPDELLPKYEWPVSLEGLFVPGYADEIAMIAPQVVFGRFQTTLLGTEGWSDADVLKTAKGYLEDAVFATDFFPFEDDPVWASFSEKFIEHYAVEPGRIAGLSYDAAMLSLKAANGSDGGDLSDYISQIEGYKGVSGTITYNGSDGFNREVIFCRIVNGEVKRAE